MSAAMAIVSSARRGMSQARTSTVLKKGWGRMSHQIFLALSMQLVRTRLFGEQRGFGNAAQYDHSALIFNFQGTARLQTQLIPNGLGNDDTAVLIQNDSGFH